MANTLSPMDLMTQSRGRNQSNTKTPSSYQVDALNLAIQQYKQKPTKDRLNLVMRLADSQIETTSRKILGAYASPITLRRARILAAQAIPKYDPALGAKFSTFLFNSLMPLNRLAPRMSEPLQVPEQLLLDKKRIEEAQKDFLDMEGREPTDEELADYTSINVKRINKVRATSVPVNEGRFTDIEDPDEVVGMGVNANNEQDIDLMYHDLSDDDKQVYSHRTGYLGAKILSPDEIAKKMNKDPKWVSQRASKVQEKINNVLGRA